MQAFGNISGSPEFSTSSPPTSFRSMLADNGIAPVQLHAHLSGSISRQCLHEVWLMKKEAGETDLADPLVEMPDGKHDYNLKTYVNRRQGRYHPHHNSHSYMHEQGSSPSSPRTSTTSSTTSPR